MATRRLAANAAESMVTRRLVANTAESMVTRRGLTLIQQNPWRKAIVQIKHRTV